MTWQDFTQVVVGGGGGPAYFNGNEVFRDLSAGNLTLALTDMRKTYILYSSVDGKTVTLPAANGAGMAAGVGVGFRIMTKSKPIKVLNAGTPGTDAVLEAFGLPGADFALFATSIATAAGDWKGSGVGLFNGPVPVTMPNVQDAGIDFGSVILAGSMSGPAGSLDILPNGTLTRLSSTLYVWCGVPNAGTSVVCYAVSYNHTTDAWTWGSPVTAFSSANQWSFPRVIGLSATTYAVLAWEATNAKVSARAATVSGTTITQGTTILSGSWGVNPSSQNSMSLGSLVADSATTFFHVSPYNGSLLGILHFSVSGTTLTQDGGATFASSSWSPSIACGGFSPSANVIDLSIASDTSLGYGVSRYTYAAGSVTNTWNRRHKMNAGDIQGVLWCADAINRVYYVMNQAVHTVYRFVLNAGATDFSEIQMIPIPGLGGASMGVTLNMGRILILSDNEMATFVPCPAVAGGHSGSFSLFDPTVCLRGRQSQVATTGTDNGPLTHVPEAQFGFSNVTCSSGTLAIDALQSNRRMAMLYSTQTQTLAALRRISMQMFDLPRNYDRAMML